MRAILLLILSNVFMTFAWYGHLKWFPESKGKATPLFLVILLSWGIAFFEYCFQVPANRIGSNAGMSGAQLKILQEAITILVFIVFAATYLEQRIQWNHIAAFALVLAAVILVYLPGTNKGSAAIAEPSSEVAIRDER